jgi:hypothetical protein
MPATNAVFLNICVLLAWSKKSTPTLTGGDWAALYSRHGLLTTEKYLKKCQLFTCFWAALHGYVGSVNIDHNESMEKCGIDKLTPLDRGNQASIFHASALLHSENALVLRFL